VRLKSLPPDADLLRLAARINSKLEPGIAVNFFCTEYPDGSAETGIIFQCGDRRAIMRTRALLGDGDTDDIVRSITAWVANVQYQHRWTLDPSEAA
jgi:hypothetical protein